MGRLEDPRQGVKFLIGADEHEVTQVGKVFFELNEARKEIERSIVAEVQQMIELEVINVTEDNVIIASSKNWPPGVIGLSGISIWLVHMVNRLFYFMKQKMAY